MSGDIRLCSGSGCFNTSLFMVVPHGKWRNMPAREACGTCVKGITKAYTTLEGAKEPGWAEVFKREGVAK